MFMMHNSHGYAIIYSWFWKYFWGYFSKDLFIGLGTPIFLNNIFILPSNLVSIDSEFANAF